MAVTFAMGIIELASIYKGYEVQDAILKSARVEKMIARTICSGKFLIVIKGTVSDVEAALELANQIGGFAIVNSTNIPNVDERVFPAIAGCTVLERTRIDQPIDALLVIETFSVVSAIRAADYAAKEAELDVLSIHVAMAIGGKGIVVLTGGITALEAAVKPAIEYCKEDGMLAGYALIRHPHEDVLKELI